MNFLTKLIDALKGNVVCVYGHDRPDGDALGAQIAVTQFLREQKIEAYLALNPQTPYNLLCLLRDTPKLPAETIDQTKTLAVFVDCGDKTRVEGFNARGQILANIDHHEGNPLFALYNCVEPHRSSTCELLCVLFQEYGWFPNLTAAQALYLGILTDTGNFSHSNTTASVFQATAYLLNHAPVNPHALNQIVFGGKSLEQIRLLSLFLSRISLTHNGYLAYIELDKKDYEATHTQHSDTEGFISFALTLRNVKAAAFIETQDDTVKGSLRSQDPSISVLQVAKQFQGGGHICAAGFKTTLSSGTYSKEKLLTAFNFLNDTQA